jgi:hypothetical protein
VAASGSPPTRVHRASIQPARRERRQTRPSPNRHSARWAVQVARLRRGSTTYIIHLMTAAPDEDIRISPARRQQWRLAAMGAIMSAVSVVLFLAGIGGGVHGLLFLLVGAPGALFFVPSTAYLLGQAARRGPALILSTKGFTDHASAIGVGFVPWGEVASIRSSSVRGRAFVAVRIRDPRAVLARQPAYRRALLRLNRKWFNGDVFIPENVLPISAKKLISLMNEKRSAEGA